MTRVFGFYQPRPPALEGRPTARRVESWPLSAARTPHGTSTSPPLCAGKPHQQAYPVQNPVPAKLGEADQGGPVP